MIWYLSNTYRFRLEREGLEELANRSNWLHSVKMRIDEEFRLHWEAEIMIGSKSFPITMRYPNHFPGSPILVLPREPDVRWSGHQWGAGGELCLEYGADNWHPEITGAQMLESAHRLLQIESGGEESVPAPSRHRLTEGQSLKNSSLRVVATTSLEAFVRAVPVGECLAATIEGIIHKETFISVVTNATRSDGTQWEADEIPEALKLVGSARTLAIMRLPLESERLRTESVQAIKEDLEQLGLRLPDVQALLVVRENKWSFCYLWNDGTTSNAKLIFAERTGARQSASHSILKERKVAIVGCGSLGSKVAVSLSRAGVGKFILIDDDILKPENLVRHDLDWRDVGTHKVHSAANKIELVNSMAAIDCHTFRFAAQHPAQTLENMISGLAACDLIVDATAEPSAFNYLVTASEIGKTPFVWGEVFGGGIGGFIARSRPGVDPQAQLIRASINNWFADKDFHLSSGAPQYEQPADGEGADALIADDADVSVIASHLARFAIDVLIPRTPSLFPYSVYMIGMAGGSGFAQPFQTEPIDLGSLPMTQNAPKLSEEEDLAEKARIGEILLSSFNENKDKQ